MTPAVTVTGAAAARAAVPVAVVTAAIIAVWYVFSVALNSAWTLDKAATGRRGADFPGIVSDTMSQDLPILPAPHQIVSELWDSTANKKVTSKRSLVYHGVGHAFRYSRRVCDRNGAGNSACGRDRARPRDEHGRHAVGHCKPSHSHSGFGADDHRRAALDRLEWPAAQGGDIGIPELLPGRRGHGRGIPQS